MIDVDHKWMAQITVKQYLIFGIVQVLLLPLTKARAIVKFQEISAV